MKSLYEILGVAKDATRGAIRGAYKSKCQRLHPDKNGGEHSEEFLEVSEAYAILADAAKRKHYDETGENPGQHSEPTETEKARSYILGAMVAAIQKIDDLEHNDMINVVRQMIAQARDKARAELGKQTNLQDKYRKAAKRVSSVDDNFVSAALEVEAGKIQSKIISITKDLKMVERALEMLEHFSYSHTKLESLWPTNTSTTAGAGFYHSTGD